MNAKTFILNSFFFFTH